MASKILSGSFGTNGVEASPGLGGVETGLNVASKRDLSQNFSVRPVLSPLKPKR